MYIIQLLGRVIASVALVSFTSLAPAGEYPQRPIRFIIPAPPGGGADVIARAFGDRLSQRLGQPLVYDNRAGAGGIIGSELAAKARPDGHTILIVTSAHTINPSLYKKLPYDVEIDFEPVGLVASTSYVLSAHPSVPVRTLKDLIALAKAKPGQFNYGSAGKGTSNHLAMEFLKMTMGIDLVHVPYKGGSPATRALLGGEVNVTFASPPHVIPHIKAGKLTPLATTGEKRLPSLSDVPTVAEQGYPGYLDKGWYGILVPAGTPLALVANLNNMLIEVQQLPEISQFYLKQGLEPASGKTTEEFRTFIKAQVLKWRKVVERAGI